MTNPKVEKMQAVWERSIFDQDCPSLDVYCLRVVLRLQTWYGTENVPSPPSEIATDVIEHCYDLLTLYRIIKI